LWNGSEIFGTAEAYRPPTISITDSSTIRGCR
jgi:hypothetical protein